MTTQQPIRSLDQAQGPLFLGIDVGGTNIKIGLVDDIGQTFAYVSIDTEEPRGPADAMQRVVSATQPMLAEIGVALSQIARVGLGTPGSQDIPRGTLIAPPNHPHWHNFPIVACLEKEIGRPVSFANDANAASWGEFWIGTGAKDSSMILLTLGTGVGGGIIIDNQLVVGQNSFWRRMRTSHHRFATRRAIVRLGWRSRALGSLRQCECRRAARERTACGRRSQQPLVEYRRRDIAASLRSCPKRAIHSRLKLSTRRPTILRSGSRLWSTCSIQA